MKTADVCSFDVCYASVVINLFYSPNSPARSECYQYRAVPLASESIPLSTKAIAMIPLSTSAIVIKNGSKSRQPSHPKASVRPIQFVFSVPTQRLLMIDGTPLTIGLLLRIVQMLRHIQYRNDMLVAQNDFTRLLVLLALSTGHELRSLEYLSSRQHACCNQD